MKMGRYKGCIPWNKEKRYSNGHMTIEEKVSKILSKFWQDCNQGEGEDYEIAIKAILTLIKPMSRETIDLLIKLSQKPKEMLSIMEEHNIVIDDLNNIMQKYAFTLYSEIVQLGNEADAILKEWEKK